jgi:hypothetical protein
MNSITPIVILSCFLNLKNSLVKVNLYQFEGITCSGCMNTVTKVYRNKSTERKHE